MAYSRYAYAAALGAGQDVLEVGCGAGIGLGILARSARRVVGGDFTDRLLRLAKTHYGARIQLVRLDAHALPFPQASFDLVVLYEAVYYLHDTARCFRDCHRILRPGGTLLLCTVNCAWPDFNPSPLSTRYFGATALTEALARCRFATTMYGAFPATNLTARLRATSMLKRGAIASGLMPRTMQGKELLKRIVFGTVVPIPAELTDGLTDYQSPTPLEADSDGYKVLYAVARRT